MTARKNVTKSRGKPFDPGNSGKPKGACQKTTLLAEKLMQADAKEIVKAIVQAAVAGDMSAVRLIPERLIPAQRDSKLTALAQRAEEAVLKAVAAGKLAVTDARHLLRLTSEIRNNPIYALSDFQRRAAVVHIGMMRGDSIDDMLAELELDDEGWSAADKAVSRETWEAIDAYYGHPRPNSAAR